MIKKESRNKARIRRHMRIRKKIHGSKDVPRLSVFRSNRNIEVQIIDDDSGCVLFAINSKTLKLKNSNIKTAQIIGELVAEKCKEKNINQIVFDRSGYIYHGCIKALAEAARNGGLKF